MRNYTGFHGNRRENRGGFESLRSLQFPAHDTLRQSATNQAIYRCFMGFDSFNLRVSQLATPFDRPRLGQFHSIPVLDQTRADQANQHATSRRRG